MRKRSGKKSGFTLIEVLGIIIVLSVISSVAVVTVDKNIKQGKVTVCSTQEANIIESAKTYLVDYPDTINQKVTMGMLKNGGYLDKELKNPMTGEVYTDDTYVLNDHGIYKISYIGETDCNGERGKTVEEILADLPVMKSWKNGASTDFHAYSYKNFISKLVFEDNMNIPEGATSWDVSANNNGSVKAWVTSDPEESGRYILHIGGNGGVVASPNSAYSFKDFDKLKSISFNGNYDTSYVTDMSSMFYGCKNLTNIDVRGFDTSSVQTMAYMFRNCTNLTNIEFPDNWASNTKYMYDMFGYCQNLKDLDLSGWNTGNVTSMVDIFEYCQSLTTLDLSNFDTKNLKGVGGMFEGCSHLESIKLPKNFVTNKVTSTDSMFWKCYNLKTVDVSNFDTSKVTSMYYMFNGCYNLTSLDVSKWNTSNATNMGEMFSGCRSLTNLDVSKWDTSKVINMGGMFAGCSSLTNLDVSHFDTSNSKSMEAMFSGCSNLTSLDVRHFDSSKVTQMDGMFYDCKKLNTIDVSHFDTSNVTNMGGQFDYATYHGMFENCSNITSLDLSSFDTSKVTNMIEMFRGCSNLKTIYASNKFVIPEGATTGSMFRDAYKLVGGNGTTYSNTSGEFARIDTESTPGYFTKKS